MSAKALRCIQCSTEFSEEEVTAAVARGAQGCPSCGTTAIAAPISWDVTLRTNWHELRVLAIWAENYSRTLPAESQQLFRAICERLELHRPAGAPPLLLAATVKEVQGLFPSMELVGSDGKVIIPKKDIQ